MLQFILGGHASCAKIGTPSGKRIEMLTRTTTDAPSPTGTRSFARSRPLLGVAMTLSLFLEGAVWTGVTSA